MEHNIGRKGQYTVEGDSASAGRNRICRKVAVKQLEWNTISAGKDSIL
jgi:hypothetical protein